MDENFLKTTFADDYFVSSLQARITLPLNRSGERDIEVQVVAKEEFLNHFDFLHGGFLLSLVDITCCMGGVAWHCRNLPREVVETLQARDIMVFTSQLDYKFLSPVRSGDVLKAKAKVVLEHGSRYQLVCEILSHSPGRERVVGTGNVSMKISIPKLETHSRL